MIELAELKKCTGCMSCYNSCAKGAIIIEENSEGFLYPHIDLDKCVGCGLCVKRCPELNRNIIASKCQYPKAYAVINNKDKKYSSSGGAFSMIARWILGQKGIVFGAAMNEEFVVEHIAVESIEDLYKIRGSKYVQSSIGNSYQVAKDNLIKGRKVLFTGTGCQIAGLYAFLNNLRYEGQLYTLDLVCHGVPSHGAFKAYIEKLKKSTRLKGEKREIVGFSFRKLDSWAYHPAIKFAKAKELMLNLSDNAYMNAFFRGLIFRESCYQCPYCNTNRVGTYTIADFWGIGKYGVPFKKNISRGVSLLIDNEGSFEMLIQNFKDSYIEQRDLSEALHEQMNLKKPMERPAGRDTSVLSLMDEQVSLYQFSKDYGLSYKSTFSSRIVFAMKKFIINTGLLNLYMVIGYKFSLKR